MFLFFFVYCVHITVIYLFSGDNLPAAKEALVSMLTSLNENWKIPVGYFFIDKITGVQLSSLVKQCINLLINCDITLTFITFDGLP